MEVFLRRLRVQYLLSKYAYTMVEDHPDGRVIITREFYDEMLDHEHCDECEAWMPVDAKYCPQCGLRH